MKFLLKQSEWSEGCKMFFNNVIIHRYPDSPYVVKAKMNLRWKDRIEMSIPMRDEAACREYLERHGWSGVKTRVISHSPVEYSTPLAHGKKRTRKTNNEKEIGKMSKEKKPYVVEFTATYTKSVLIYADNADEALEFADGLYEDGEIDIEDYFPVITDTVEAATEQDASADWYEGCTWTVPDGWDGE